MGQTLPVGLGSDKFNTLVDQLDDLVDLGDEWRVVNGELRLMDDAVQRLIDKIELPSLLCAWSVYCSTQGIYEQH
jgi:hypothetical protein